MAVTDAREIILFLAEDAAFDVLQQIAADDDLTRCIGDKHITVDEIAAKFRDALLGEEEP